MILKRFGLFMYLMRSSAVNNNSLICEGRLWMGVGCALLCVLVLLVCDSVSGFSGVGIAMGIFAFAGMKFCSQMMACLLER